jgi:hypothetical protein
MPTNSHCARCSPRESDKSLSFKSTPEAGKGEGGMDYYVLSSKRGSTMRAHDSQCVYRPDSLHTPLQNKPNDAEPVTHPPIRILSVDGWVTCKAQP